MGLEGPHNRFVEGAAGEQRFAVIDCADSASVEDHPPERDIDPLWPLLGPVDLAGGHVGRVDNLVEVVAIWPVHLDRLDLGTSLGQTTGSSAGDFSHLGV